MSSYRGSGALSRRGAKSRKAAASPQGHDPVDLITLSDDEAELVHLVAEGMDVHAIALETGAGEGTVKRRLAALVLRLSSETGYRPAGGD